MINIAPSYRAFAGVMVAAALGVAFLAGAKASADPLPPAPQPVPAVASQAPPAQSVTAPGGTSRFVATPPVPNGSAPRPPPPCRWFRDLRPPLRRRPRRLPLSPGRSAITCRPRA